MVKNNKKPNEKRKGNHSSKFDIKDIKKKINKELYSKKKPEAPNKNNNLYSPLFLSNNTLDNIEDREKEYYDKYTIYMAEQFNSKLVNMIILYINKDKKLPVKYQKELNFINTFIELVKSLLMNEFEFALFTIILDQMGLEYNKFDHWIYFRILGIYTKQLLGRRGESDLFKNMASKKDNNFNNKYSQICEEEIVQKINESLITVKLINERFRQLTRPINSYCRKNYINYNGIVDKIVKLSQPYGEESNGNQLYCDQKLKEIKAHIESHTNNVHIDINNNNFNGNNISNYECKLNPYFMSNEQNNFRNSNSNNYFMLQPSISNNFREPLNFNNSINRYNASDLNNLNSIMPNLSLVNKSSSQFFLKLENNPSNSDLNNL